MSALKLGSVMLVLASGIGLRFWNSNSSTSHLTIRIDPPEIIADGYTKAVIEVESSEPPRLTVLESRRGVRIAPVVQASEGVWRAAFHAGVSPGPITIRAEANGVTAETKLNLLPDQSDRESNGMPDAVQLDTAEDQQAFRRWFTFLAEAQFFQTESERPKEINDCAALIRYAYREALRPHDSAWVSEARLPLVLGLDSVDKYQYPFTLLGPSLFRVRPGAYHPGAADDFSQFADASTLQRFNSHFVSRDIRRAEPGDLLFFRHEGADLPFHGMIYIGQSQIRDGSRTYFLYHTGPDASDPGEIRRPSVDELMNHPVPQWRPHAGNPTFLGVYRWNILP